MCVWNVCDWSGETNYFVVMAVSNSHTNQPASWIPTTTGARLAPSQQKAIMDRSHTERCIIICQTTSQHSQRCLDAVPNMLKSCLFCAKSQTRNEQWHNSWLYYCCVFFFFLFFLSVNRNWVYGCSRIIKVVDIYVLVKTKSPGCVHKNKQQRTRLEQTQAGFVINTYI